MLRMAILVNTSWRAIEEAVRALVASLRMRIEISSCALSRICAKSCKPIHERLKFKGLAFAVNRDLSCKPTFLAALSFI